MSYHNESTFQRLQAVRARHVNELRDVLMSEGLPTDADGQEALIRVAQRLRSALAPFDNSIPRPAEDRS